MRRTLILFISIAVLIISGCESSVVPDPSTSIKYTIPENADVKLTIENSYHTTIAVLVERPHAAGVYMVNLDNLSLPEGIYFYTLEIKGNQNYYSKTTYHLLLLK